MTYCALRQKVEIMTTGKQSEEVEKEYMQAVGRVKHPRKIQQCFHLLVEGLERKRYDFLGTFSGDLGVNDKKHKGQFFTPPGLCKLMAQITVKGVKPVSGRTLWLSEPASGGGAMLIATTDALYENGFSPFDIHWVANDIDRACYQMTYIQTTLLGIPCEVRQENTLTLEQWNSNRNFISYLYPWKQRTCTMVDRNGELFDLTTFRDGSHKIRDAETEVTQSNPLLDLLEELEADTGTPGTQQSLF